MLVICTMEVALETCRLGIDKMLFTSNPHSTCRIMTHIQNLTTEATHIERLRRLNRDHDLLLAPGILGTCLLLALPVVRYTLPDIM